MGNFNASQLPKETVNAWHTRTVSGYNWFSCIIITWHSLPHQALACTTVTCWPIPFWEPARRSGLCFDISMYVARNACQWMKSWLNRLVLDSRMPCSTCWDIPNDCLMVGVNWRARTISCSCVGVTSPWCFMQWPTTLESWETHGHQDTTCHWLNKKAEWSKTCEKWSRYCNTKVCVWIRSLGGCTLCVWPRRWTCWTSPSHWLALRWWLSVPQPLRREQGLQILAASILPQRTVFFGEAKPPVTTTVSKEPWAHSRTSTPSPSGMSNFTMAFTQLREDYQKVQKRPNTSLEQSPQQPSRRKSTESGDSIDSEISKEMEMLGITSPRKTGPMHVMSST